MGYVYIAVGGSLGALARYFVSKFVGTHMEDIFPYGTMVANLSGSFFMGFLFEFFEQSLVSPGLRNLIAVGFIGAYTTFSTFMLESVNLMRAGEYRLAAWNLVASNVLGVAFVFSGLVASRYMLQWITHR